MRKSKYPIIFLAILSLLSLFSNIFLLQYSHESQIENVFKEPSLAHPFGFDSLGRDLFLRVLVAGKISFFLCIGASAFSLIIGFLIGGIAGYRGGWIDRALMRICEVLMAIPHIILIAIFAIFFQNIMSDSQFLPLIAALSVSGWMPFARHIRNLVQEVKVQPFIFAAECLGYSKVRIIKNHILPNILGGILIYWGLQIPSAIMAEGILSFLGLGVKSPEISWGTLLNEGWKTIFVYPHVIIGPSIVVTLTAFSIHWILVTEKKWQFKH